MIIKRDNYKLIKVALTVTRLLSLVLSIEILTSYIINYKKSYLGSSLYLTLISITIFLITFYIIYYILFEILFRNKKPILKYKFASLTQIVILMLIFSIIIIISGGDNSSYKTLFLFAIIGSSINGGLKGGVVASLISSFLILLINFTFKQSSLTFILLEHNIIICTMLIFLACILGYYVNTSKKYRNNLENLANKDGLTDVYNHKYFYNKLEEIFNISKLNAQKLSLMFLDIDDFKHYNDSNGHQRGDDALKNIANILKYSVKEKDIIARYGGEEFVVIMKDSDKYEAITLAEKIRLAIENSKFYGEEKQPSGKLTVSIGISEYSLKVRNSEELVKIADNALYKAKFHHKNTVEA